MKITLVPLFLVLLLTCSGIGAQIQLSDSPHDASVPTSITPLDASSALLPLFVGAFAEADPAGLPPGIFTAYRQVAAYCIDLDNGVLQIITGSPFTAENGMRVTDQNPNVNERNGAWAFNRPPDGLRDLRDPLTETPVSSMDATGSGGSAEITGPVGIGAERYVSGNQQLAYAISFTNSPTASTPVRNVFVSNPIPEGFDIASIQVGGVPVTNPFTATMDLRPTRDFLIKIDVAFDTGTRVLTWTIQSIDPVTNQPPADPLAGFLAPGDVGTVFFTAMSQAGLATGTVLQNQAAVVFDGNAPGNTPIWANTLDNTPPSSHVLTLPSSSSATFSVSWTGSDIGSGIKDFTLYVSDNGGPFTAWLQDTAATSATYTGQSGHSYAFYSILRDLVGNLELSKNVGEAATLVTSNAPGQPADTNNDWRLSINEITAYGAAWKRGDSWPREPTPIPIDYLTNAGALWKTGELYRYDSTLNPPLCWIKTDGGSGPLLSKAARLSARARNDVPRIGPVTATIIMAEGVGRRASTIDILIAPGDGGQVYAVEETVPSGWNVSGVSEGGEYDRKRRKVRWGLFFDNASRRLSYTALPAKNSKASGTFSGVISFDGKSTPIRHNKKVSNLGVGVSK